jgi:hypothetical protein
MTLANDQLDAQIYNTFITILYMYMFWAISCSSSGGQIVLTQNLVSSLSVNDRSVHRLRQMFICLHFFICCGAATQCRSWPPRSWGFLDHTQRRTTVGGTPLDEWPARRRDPYLTTHNTHNRQTSMPPVGFETTISASERPQTYALERAATGTGMPTA